MPIRKRSFGISIKLSLTVTFIIIISFLLIFAFFQKTQKQELRKKMLDELSLKLDSLKQDIRSYSFSLQAGELQLLPLQKKVNSMYQKSFSDKNQLAVFKEMTFVNRRGKIIAHNRPSLSPLRNGLKPISLVQYKKKKSRRKDFKKFLKHWVALKLNISNKALINIENGLSSSILEIATPLYSQEKNTYGINHTQLFFELWENFQKKNLLSNLSISPFFINTFQYFSELWQYRSLIKRNLRPTKKGEELLSFLKESRKKSRKRRSNIPKPPLLSKNDLKRVEQGIQGIYLFSQTYWYKRIKEGEKLQQATQVLKKALEKRKILGKITTIQNIIEQNIKRPYSDWQGELVINTLQLKKLNQKTLLPLKKLVPKKRRDIFHFFSNIFELPSSIEEITHKNSKRLKAFLKSKNEMLDWWRKNLSKNLNYLKNLLNDFLVVTLPEQYSVFSKRFLKKSIKSLFRIKIALNYQKNYMDEEKLNFEQEKLKEARNNWIKKATENQLIFHPISLENHKKNMFSTHNKKELYSFYFFFYIHHFLDTFRNNDGSFSPSIEKIIQADIPKDFKNFSENDIKSLEEKVSFLRNFLSEINIHNLSSIESKYKSAIYLQKSKLSFKKKFVQDLFQSLISRYQIGHLIVRVSEENINLAIHKKNNSLIDLGLSLLIRFVFVAVLLSLFFLKKFHILFFGVEKAGAGDLNHKISIKGRDEFGQLADHFNHMTNNLQKAQIDLIEKSRMEEELKIAERIQSSLLPKEYPNYPTLKFASYYNAQTETGGDYFDFIELDDKNVALVIADVAGHGVGACLVMSMIRTLIRSYAPLIKNPKEILVRINDYVFQDTPSNMYATIFYAIFNTEEKKMIYSIGGHNAGIIFNPNSRKVKTLKIGGMAAGLVPSATYKNIIKNYQTVLESGEIFLQYTDGVTEAENKANELYGMERLLNVFQNNSGNQIDEIFDLVIQDLDNFTKGYIQADDITMMGCQIH